MGMRIGYCAVAACMASLAGIGLARQAAREELQEQIKALETRVTELESRQLEPTADARDADAVIRAVMQDAQRRSDPIGPLLPGSGGHDEDGFYLRSTDGSFVMRPEIFFQFRGVVTHRNNPPGGGSDTDSGFEVRRMEFAVEGNVFTEKLTYEFRVVAEQEGGGLSTEDVWLQYEFARAWAFLFGQFRDPVFHEELVSSRYLLAVDRTLVNRLLASSTGFVQGVSISYGDSDTPLHAAAAFHDGAGSINTPFPDSQGETGFIENFGIAGRAEYKFFGEWKNYKDFTARSTKTNLLVAGAGADFTQGRNTDLIFATADAQWETPGGLAVYAALLSNYHDSRNIATSGSRFDWGGLVQVAYLFTGSWEAFGRYDYTELDDDSLPNDAFNEFAVGLNYYLGRDGGFGHNAKLTLDLVYLPDGSPADATGLGILASEGDQIVMRGQFQLVL